MARRRYSTKRKTYRKHRSHTKRKFSHHVKKGGKMSIKRLPNLMPDKMLVKMKYSDTFQFTQTWPNQPQNYVYSGNDAYDPNVTGTGNWANGFRNWIQPTVTTTGAVQGFYQKWRVRASAIDVMLLPINAGTTGIAHFSLIPDQLAYVSPTGINVANMSERRYAKYRPIMGNYAGAVYCKHYMTTSKILGVERGVEDQDIFAASGANSPSTRWFWNLSCQAVDEASTLSIWVRVRVKYYVECYEPVPIT